LTNNKRNFINNSQIKTFWDEFTSSINKPNIVNEKNKIMNCMKNQEVKLYETYLKYLLDIFLEEFKIDEYNLDQEYSVYYKSLEVDFKKMKKLQTLDSTIEMTNYIVFIYFKNLN